MKLPSVRVAAASLAVLTAVFVAARRLHRKRKEARNQRGNKSAKQLLKRHNEALDGPPSLSNTVCLPLKVVTTLVSQGTALSAEALTPFVGVMFFTPATDTCFVGGSSLAISHAFVFVEDLCAIAERSSVSEEWKRRSAPTIDQYLCMTQCAFLRSTENGSDTLDGDERIVIPLDSFHKVTGCAASHAIVKRTFVALIGCDADNLLAFGLVLTLEPQAIPKHEGGDSAAADAQGASAHLEELVPSVLHSPKWAALLAELCVPSGRHDHRQGGTIRALVTRKAMHGSKGRVWLSASAEHVLHATGITVAVDAPVPALTYVDPITQERSTLDLTELPAGGGGASVAEDKPSEDLVAPGHANLSDTTAWRSGGPCTVAGCSDPLVASSSGLLLSNDATDDALVLAYLHNPMGVSFQLKPGAAIDEVAWMTPGSIGLQYVLHPWAMGTTPVVRMERWARLPSLLEELIRDNATGSDSSGGGAVGEFVQRELSAGIHRAQINEEHAKLAVHEVTAFGRHAWAYEEFTEAHRCRTYLCFTGGAAVNATDQMFLLRWETPTTEWARYGPELRSFLDTLHVAL